MSQRSRAHPWWVTTRGDNEDGPYERAVAEWRAYEARMRGVIEFRFGQERLFWLVSTGGRF